MSMEIAMAMANSKQFRILFAVFAQHYSPTLSILYLVIFSHQTRAHPRLIHIPSFCSLYTHPGVPKSFQNPMSFPRQIHV